MSLRKILKLLAPPLLLRIMHWRHPQGWYGNYQSWSDARNNCRGYDAPEILEKCKSALLKVKHGDAVYERDSKTFDSVQYSWPVLAAILRCALENDGKLHVLDFGGSLGSSYYQIRGFLPPLKEFTWNIVEQEHFVTCGKENFEDGTLKFFENVEACLKRCSPNILLLSSVLQYLDEPYQWIRRLCILDIPNIVVDLTPLIDADDRLTIQEVDPALYLASYPCWLLNKSNFIKAFQPEYHVISEFDAYIGKDIPLGFSTFSYKGILFRRSGR